MCAVPAAGGQKVHHGLAIEIYRMIFQLPLGIQCAVHRTVLDQLL
jgi:hypothetical protein